MSMVFPDACTLPTAERPLRLAERTGVPAGRLRRYAEAGLLPPAQRHGDGHGYPAGEAAVVSLLARVEDLGGPDPQPVPA